MWGISVGRRHLCQDQLLNRSKQSWGSYRGKTYIWRWHISLWLQGRWYGCDGHGLYVWKRASYSCFAIRGCLFPLRSTIRVSRCVLSLLPSEVSSFPVFSASVSASLSSSFSVSVNPVGSSSTSWLPDSSSLSESSSLSSLSLSLVSDSFPSGGFFTELSLHTEIFPSSF